MNLQDSVRLPEAIVKAFSHPDARSRGGGNTTVGLAPPLTIAISRQAGARGTSIAQDVGRRLGWPVLDHELLEQMATEMHVNVRLLDHVDEQHVPWMVERLEAFSSIPYVSESAYVRQLLETILSIGARGQCVIVGRGASHILPPPLVIRVRLIGEFADRAQAIMRETSTTLEDAERQVKALDQRRVAFIKNHFHCDPTAPESYDLVLNTSRLEVETCSQIIIAVLEERRKAWSGGGESH
jgi:cytidylate kinase